MHPEVSARHYVGEFAHEGKRRASRSRSGSSPAGATAGLLSLASEAIDGAMAEVSSPVSDDLMAEHVRAIAEHHDRDAFRAIFAAYAPKLKAFLARGGLEDAIAEELVQDVMLTVWRRAATFDPRQGTFAAWLFTIARNRRIDHFRRAPKPFGDDPDPMLLPEPPASAEGLVEARQHHTLIKAAMDELPPEQVEVLRMAFFEQKSHSAIAEEQGLPLGTVKSRIRLAMRQLRRTLEPQL